MTTQTTTRGARLLESMSDELDVSPSKYEDAKKRYVAVGNWLGEGEKLKPRKPEIYPQGSFAIGTAIRPPGDGDYDVDAVCQVIGTNAELLQQELKALVGDRLKENATYRSMLDPREGGRRCWTLKYADASKFHLDVLPAIPDSNWKQLLLAGVPEEFAKHALLITDKTRWHDPRDWTHTNPRGYAAWFKARMRVRLEEAKRLVAASRRASVADIQDFEVRTPLQRLVQLLKRHRDVYFNDDPLRPISVIITTLAARAYDNEADLATALLNVVPAMRQLVEMRGNVFWIANPVNPAENFADKWEEEPEKAEAFFRWVEQVDRDHRTLVSEDGLRNADRHLAEAYGERDTAAALQRAGFERQPSRSPIAATRSRTPSRFDVPHRQKPGWDMAPAMLPVPITAEYTHGARKQRFESNSAPLPKKSALNFHADVPVAPPYEVHWQVVNTGREAADVGGLRGEILLSKTAGIGGRHEREESTLYTGAHWIQCFVVKNGVCVARSTEFVVNIE